MLLFYKNYSFYMLRRNPNEQNQLLCKKNGQLCKGINFATKYLALSNSIYGTPS